MRREELQERFRRMLQRRASVAGLRIPLVGERYRDERGRMATVRSSGSQLVAFERDGYTELCVLPVRQFDKQFKRVSA